MICRACGHKSIVFNSAKTDKHVYRERKCYGCGNRWYTVEAESDDNVRSMITTIKEAKRFERTKKN